MKKVSFSPLIVAVILFCSIFLIPSKQLVPLISSHIVNKAATGLDPNMFQGELIQKKMLENKKYLPIYGSSELSRLDPFHPSNYFRVNPAGFTPFLVGRGGTQSIVHFLNFSVNEKGLKNKKIVFILSPQWFNESGIDEQHFDPNFSVLQAYEFALHPSVNKKLQQEGAKRLLDFDIVKHDKMLKTLLEAKIHREPTYQLKANLTKPFAYGFLKVLERRDLVISIFKPEIRKLNIDPTLTENLSWDKLEENAASFGEKNANSNPFYINNRYFKKRIASKIDDLKGYRKGQSFAISPEYHDLQMVLDVLKEAKAKPIFISVPVNGYWYDYAEFPEKGRLEYYKKVKEQINAAGFPVVDLSKHEYDKHFLEDTMHLGPKGWTFIDRALLKFYKNN